MSYGPPKRTFVVLGIIVGALLGFIYSAWLPPTTEMLFESGQDLMLNPKMLGITVLVFSLIQYGLGIILKRPYESTRIHLGLLVIPLTWLHSYLFSPSINDKLAYIILVLGFEIVPILIPILFATLVIDRPLPFFAGFNTYALDNEKLPSEDVFAYEFEIAKNEVSPSKLIQRMWYATGFSIFRSSPKSNKVGWVVCKKGKLHEGIFYETNNPITHVTFVFFRIANDTVRRLEEFEEVLDIKAQIGGMLESWTQRKRIVRFDKKKPNLTVGLEQLSEGLGPLRIPIPELGKTIKSFPKNHPYQFALLTALLPTMVSIILFLLGKIRI